MIRSEYGHLIRRKSSGYIFTPSHSSALMGRCTGWWRRSRGSSAGSSPASSPASRGSSSASSSSSSFLPSVFAGVPTSYRSGDPPCWCPDYFPCMDRSTLTTTSECFEIYITFGLCNMLTHQYSNFPFMLWNYTASFLVLEQDHQFLQNDLINHTPHKMK